MGSIAVTRGRTSEARRLGLLALAAGLLWVPAGLGAANRLPPLRDPVTLNIGINCQWQKPCIDKQRKAMKRALSYVKKANPPLWKVQQCNRNASRRGHRVDWIGYDHCIRNPALRYIPPPATPAAARKGKRKRSRLRSIS